MLARLHSGWVVLGDPQVIAGYCLLLPDPVVPDLNALSQAARGAFLSDMATVGDVLLGEFGATRINYAIFGNVEPALHAHVFPRRSDEAPALVTAHPWAHDWTGAPPFDSGQHAPLVARLKAAFDAVR
jgi:diadenosine tetraphosphate (Ap4A) HIT family hydrolase